MIDQKLAAWGRSGNIIREIAEYGAEQAKIVGADHVYNFTIGSPSIDPPACVFETMDRLRATVPAWELHTYAPAAGLPDVREKAAAYLTRSFGVPYRKQDIIITCGTSTCLVVMTKVLLSAGGRAMTFTPYFMDYKYYAESVGSTLTECPTVPDTFQLDLDAAERALTPDTMMLILNSPNNPSGVVYSRETLEGMAALLRKKSAEYGHPIYIVCDEPYRELVYDGGEVPYVPAIYNNTVICYSWSKSLSLPGERIGYFCVPPCVDDSENVYKAIQGAMRVLGHVCAPTMMQKVAAKCVGIKPDLTVYEQNRKTLYEALTSYGYRCIKPQGAFYMLIQSPNGDDNEFSEMAKLKNLLIVPGTGFGCPGFLRLSTCVDLAMVQRSLPAFKALIEECK